MSTCNGDGSCITFCSCICSIYENCICGHKHHLDIKEENRYHGFCQIPCKMGCKLIECSRHKHCGEKFPEWYIKTNDTHPMLNDANFIDALIECKICFNMRYMVHMNCGHVLCYSCYKYVFINGEELMQRCPFCFHK
jgi:hypothetical protein